MEDDRSHVVFDCVLASSENPQAHKGTRPLSPALLFFAGTISAVFRKILVLVACCGAPVCAAQQGSAPQSQPQVKVNVLNVCAPSTEEQQEIASALAKIPKRPSFSEDFEVDRGRSVLDRNAATLALGSTGQPAPSGDPAVADFVRLRRDLAGSGPYYSNVQYSFSRDASQMVETLVFRVRDPKDLLQVSIEDSASSVTLPSVMLASASPASRIKLERFGKSSIVLARCSGTSETPAPDQSKYESAFAAASSALSDYRGLFGATTLVPEELARIARIGGSANKRSTRHVTAAHK